MNNNFVYIVLSLLFFCSCNSLSSKKKPLENDDGSLCLDKKEGFLNVLSKNFNPCLPNNRGPWILASFNDYSIDKKTTNLITTLLNANSNICAPGPFLVNSQFSEQNAKLWQLSDIPQFFVWLKSSLDGEYHNFFLADQTGMPIKSTSYSIKQGQDTLVILVPNASLIKNTNYHLYIKGQHGDTKYPPYLQTFVIASLGEAI